MCVCVVVAKHLQTFFSEFCVHFDFSCTSCYDSLNIHYSINIGHIPTPFQCKVATGDSTSDKAEIPVLTVL